MESRKIIKELPATKRITGPTMQKLARWIWETNWQPMQLVLSVCILAATLVPTKSHAQSTEQRFQDLFTTAGYATAFGAALGAAALSFKQQPENHLRYVAIGASMGFIGGSVMGTYIIFAPTLAVRNDQSFPPLATNTKPGLTLSPVFEQGQGHTLNKIQGTWTFASF